MRSDEMLPTPAETDPESDFNPFLNVTDIGKKPGATATLTLTGQNRTISGNYGRQVVCEVKHGKKLFDWGITINKPNYKILFKRFGARLSKWKGDVMIERRAPMQKGRAGFLAIVATPDASPNRSKTTARKAKKR